MLLSVSLQHPPSLLSLACWSWAPKVQCSRNSLQPTYLFAFFLNPVPTFLSSSSSISPLIACPSPLNLPAPEIRLPGLRLRSVWGPVCVDDRAPASFRRRPRVRVRCWAPPHLRRRGRYIRDGKEWLDHTHNVLWHIVSTTYSRASYLCCGLKYLSARPET